MKAVITRADGIRIELEGTPAEIREIIGPEPVRFLPPPMPGQWYPAVFPYVEPVIVPHIEPTYPWPWWQGPTYTVTPHTVGAGSITLSRQCE